MRCSYRLIYALPADELDDDLLDADFDNINAAAESLMEGDKMKILKYQLDDHAVHVGTLYFHQDSRHTPKPPALEVEDFYLTHPKHPMVIRDTETSIEEEGQQFYARFLFSDDREQAIGGTATDAPLIILYTSISNVTYLPEYRDAYTIEGKQFQGMDIMDWDVVSFLASYRRDGPKPIEEVYRNIYRELRALEVYAFYESVLGGAGWCWGWYWSDGHGRQLALSTIGMDTPTASSFS